MKLVTFEDPIFLTLQGEGIWLGTPSVFVRAYGCDFSCSFCDTKDSWREGSHGMDVDNHQIIDRIRNFRAPHLVITGGNPVLQPNDVADISSACKIPYFDEKDERWKPGMMVTLETQASIYEEGLVQHIDLVSLSPKLHNWKDDVVWEWVNETLKRPDKQVQVKVVCWDRETTNVAIDKCHELCRGVINRHGSASNLHLILQPEYSRGREGIGTVRATLERYLKEALPPHVPLRIIPQTHKTSLFVR